MKMVPVLRYKREALIKFCQDYLKALGASEEEAGIVSNGVVTAASRWHPGKGQGLEKLFRLTIQTEGGGIVNGAEFEILKDTPAIAHVDGNKGYGYVVADKAMKPEDLAQAVLNVIAHGKGGPTGQTYLFGTSGSARDDSLKQIAALAP